MIKECTSKVVAAHKRDDLVKNMYRFGNKVQESHEVSWEMVYVVCCDLSDVQTTTEPGGIVCHCIYRRSGGILHVEI